MDGFGEFSILIGNRHKKNIIAISTNKEDGRFIMNYIKHGK